LVEFFFSLDDVIVLRVDDQVVVLGEDGNQRLLLEFLVPGHLLEEVEEFVFVDGVSFGEAADIDDGVQSELMLFEFAEDLFPYVGSVGDLVQAGDVQDTEAHIFPTYLEGSSVVEVHLGGDLLQAVRHFYFRVAGQQFCSRTFA
jgi:hypothetical protein